MFCIDDASTVLKRNRVWDVASDEAGLSLDKDGIYLPKYCLSLDGQVLFYSNALCHYGISVQKLLSIVKKYSLAKCKEKIRYVGNTYAIGHDDIKVLETAMNELNSIILLNNLKQE